METKEVTLGSSILVPCVQELAKSVDKDSIPSRYIRTIESNNNNEYKEEQGVISSNFNSSLFEIPVLDMQKLVDQDLMDSELGKLNFACKHWGFFQLVNHNVSTTIMEKIKKEVQDFFNRPMEEKKKYWQSEGEVEGFGQAFVVSEEQKLDWADLFFIVTQPPHLRKRHLFPMLPLPLRDTLEEYSIELKNLAMDILSQMAKALKIEAREMREVFEDGQQSMRMNYYPPCPEPDKVIGLTPHSDSVGLTILLQLNEVEGLQVKKDFKWVPVKPLPNAFICNVGDILEMVTNGTYRSIEHRAIVSSEKERLSIATFYSPSYDKEIGPAPSLINEQNPPLFKRIETHDYFKGLFSRELAGKSYLDHMRI